MNILSIGNSFSQDAQRYLHQAAEANGENLTAVNLYIGGCTLHRHYVNMLDDVTAYSYQYNGEDTGLAVSIKQALKSRNWDYITLQQASHESFDFKNYVPYLKELYDFIKRYAPKAKICIHQTWAYPAELGRVAVMGFDTTENMFAAVKDAYAQAAEMIDADVVIRSGEAMLAAYNKIRENAYRDPIHAGLGFGRYLLALVWCMTLFGVKEDWNHLSKFDVPVTEEEKQLAYEIARDIVAGEEK